MALRTDPGKGEREGSPISVFLFVYQFYVFSLAPFPIIF